MLKFIRNSKSTNKSTGYKGIRKTPSDKYTAALNIWLDGKTRNIHIGTYDTLKEAKQARVKFILSLI